MRVVGLQVLPFGARAHTHVPCILTSSRNGAWQTCIKRWGAQAQGSTSATTVSEASHKGQGEGGGHAEGNN